MACHCNQHHTPKFILPYNLWRTGGTLTPIPTAQGFCQLHVAGLTSGLFPANPGSSATFSRYLFLPPKTDIRGGDIRPQPDFVEVPAGTGRFYIVTTIDDVAKGFPNEFRVALILPFLPGWMGAGADPRWPTPYQ